MKKYINILFLIFLLFSINATADISSEEDIDVKKPRHGIIAIRCYSIFFPNEGYPAEILLISPDGKKKVGYDYETKKEVAEIRGSGYFTDVQPHLEGPDSPPWRTLEVMWPDTMGKYILKVYGIKDSMYSLSILFEDKKGNIIHYQGLKGYKGIISKAEIHEYILYYSTSHDIFLSSVKKVVDFNLIDKQLRLAVKRRYIDKKLGRELLNKWSEFKKTYPKNPNKEVLKELIDRIELEKQKYKGIREDELIHMADFVSLDLLSKDIKSFLDELK